MKNKHLVIFLLFILTVLNCKMNHGISPLPGKVNVTVYFRGTPPENTQGIYLIVAPKFPPHAINELFNSPNSLPVGRDTVYATLSLPYGHYESISLWWYSTETKSNLADVLALPLDATNNLLPLGFDITPDKPVANMELFANWSRVERDAAIEGTVYFNGPFPPNTLATAVAAYIFEPEINVQYLVWLKSIDFSVDKNPYHYRLPLRHGQVNYIAVFWLPDQANLTDFRVLGVYEDPSNPGQPGRISLKANETIKGLDIHADWKKAGG